MITLRQFATSVFKIKSRNFFTYFELNLVYNIMHLKVEVLSHYITFTYFTWYILGRYSVYNHFKRIGVKEILNLQLIFLCTFLKT